MSNKVKVNLGKESYDILFSSDFALSVKNHAEKVKSDCLIITQKNIVNLFQEQFKVLHNIDNVFFIYLEDGEKAKSIDSIMKICNYMSEKNFDRSSKIFAVGGGVVGDISGFAASIFMRGIDYYQYPTTLLAMIDSSVGGKTGINLDKGKNLVGRIYQPKEVFIDTIFLSTLPERQFNAALAEAIKYGFIYDRDLFFLINNNIENILQNRSIELIKKIITNCCEIKSDIVSEDVNENELRMILNFGHTIGHALEAYQNYKELLHGEAIFYGMKCAISISHKKGSLNESEYNTSMEVLNRFNLPLIKIKDKEKLIALIKNDKKFREKEINFILLDEIGKAYISSDIKMNDIEESLSCI